MDRDFGDKNQRIPVLALIRTYHLDDECFVGAAESRDGLLASALSARELQASADNGRKLRHRGTATSPDQATRR